MNIRELWSDVKGYEGIYKVSNYGNVLSCKKDRLLKPSFNNSGYLYVILYKNGVGKHYLIHRLVAEAFILNPEEKSDIDHINTIRDDNRVENLRWVTKSENMNNELTRKKNSESHKGKQLSEETKDRISKANTGHEVSEETRKKLSKSHEGKVGENNKNIKAVQLSKNEELIKIWTSINEADKYGGFHASSISKCCKGIRKTHKGYKWMYYEDYLNKECN